LLAVGLFLLAPPIAYWAVNTWLESSGGRKMLERSLSARTGMNVVLGGDFDLMLLPDIGVTGTDLIIESALSEGPLASSAEYEISVALKPLLDGRVQIDWIRLSGGEIHPGRYQSRQPAAGTGAAESIQIPQIEELTIRDFRVVPPGAGNGGVRVGVFEISGFADSQSAPFVVEIQDLVSARGRILLDMQKSTLELNELILERSGQRLAGDACMQLGEPFSLHVVLEAEQLDFDQLRNELPETDAWTEGGEEGSPVDIRVRVSVGELLAAGAVARGVVLSLGQEPVCGSD
jgi:uncharacterized protein involved in outer membrane biogenesis